MEEGSRDKIEKTMEYDARDKKTKTLFEMEEVRVVRGKVSTKHQYLRINCFHSV